MEKKYVKKLAEIVEKLRTADDKTAYRILDRMRFGILDKAMLSLVKKDFSLDKREAVSLLSQAVLPGGSDVHVYMSRGFFCSWHNSKDQYEKIAVGLDCTNMKQVKLLVGHTNETTARAGILEEDAAFVAPPAELKAIVDGLEGFSEKKPGFWVRPLGEIKNLAQAKRLLKPVWDEVFNAIEPFGDAW